ncbi:MAG: glutamate-ammonia-ligase adenylyltransferase [bacterium]
MAKPRCERLRQACPEVDPGLIEEHVRRLGERYFARFSEAEVQQHLLGLLRLSPEHPAEVVLEQRGDGCIACTVLAFDYPGAFALIAGLLAGTGFNVLSGDSFTYGRAEAEPPAPPGPLSAARRVAARSKGYALRPGRRRLVDLFCGTLETGLPFETWAGEFRRSLEEVARLLERGDAPSLEKARHLVNDKVVRRLALLRIEEQPALYPVHMDVDPSQPDCTRLKIVSQDTPAFLYSLAHAFSLHGIYIERVQIRTIQGRAEDEIDVTDGQGRKVEDPGTLARIRLSALLTKQFTYFLGRAPDPYAALHRFKQLIEETLEVPGKAGWLEILSDPHALKDLARLLGASDFLWEDFIRLHYEALLPMLRPYVGERRFSLPPGELSRRLDEILSGASTLEERQLRLNAFKDREIFLIELDHILEPHPSFGALAEKLTLLAEEVVNRAADFSYAHLVARFGVPRTAAGLEARFGVLGLGKLGGAALGVASDLELLVVYSDDGWTDGGESIGNPEFFNRLVQTAAQSIRAKREGIFHVDLRLRPFGSAGPLACSLEAFCSYYGRGGPAHSVERLALVRLRALGGDRTLGQRVERIRDEILYGAQAIDPGEIRSLREKQYQEKTRGGRPNAKFSPGGLVDLEYNIQVLQVLYGHAVPGLRTPHVHAALAALAQAGVLAPEETGQLMTAYDFLRSLINALRMLRGSAQDLFLPPADSLELAHLARRMGYSSGEALDPARKLHIEYETHTAAVRAFANRHFGPSSLPGPVTGTVADLVLADSVPGELSRAILASAGFQDPQRAYVNLRSLAGSGSRRRTFASLALLALDPLLKTPDPDMALNNWERFIRSLPSPEFHFHLLLGQPMRLEILLEILAASQFLADTLVRYPGLLEWIMEPDTLRRPRSAADLEDELGTAEVSSMAMGQEEWLNRIRRLRRREILRIGTRDMVLKAPTRDITLELSTLADALVRAALWRSLGLLREEKGLAARAADLESRFCILAFGKLGGAELNYSSDIDLVGVYDSSSSFSPPADSGGFEGEAVREFYTAVMERVGLALSAHTSEGYAYRVDFRLRPYGSSGELVPSVATLEEYYRRAASLWEVQAALKIRPIAGNLELGRAVTGRIRTVLLERRDRERTVRSVRRMRQDAVRKCAVSSGGPDVIDVKNGPGGLRDVEFLVQGLQLIYGPDRPGLLEANTLEGLRALREAGILPAETASRLEQDYLFLRRIEHCLQILDDRQTHALPQDPAQLKALARRVLGVEAGPSDLLQTVRACSARIGKDFHSYLT